MNIVICGGSGFIGSALSEAFIADGHHIYILSRNANEKKPSHPHVTYVNWLNKESKPEKLLKNVDILINLAGASINGKRWTKAYKKKILNSRITATQNVVKLIRSLNKKPQLVINASAIGYYGHSTSKRFTERTEPIGQSFLTTVGKQWEQEANIIESLGIRTIYARIGLVLDRDKGALPKMLTPYKFFIGGTVGSGKQWLSWIHIADVIGLIRYVIEHKNIAGAINFTAPNPIQMKYFGETLAKVIRRPHWLPAPSLAIKLLLGEMDTLVLEGQNVYPEKALKHGYPFQFTHVQDALENLLNTE